MQEGERIEIVLSLQLTQSRFNQLYAMAGSLSVAKFIEQLLARKVREIAVKELIATREPKQTPPGPDSL